MPSCVGRKGQQTTAIMDHIFYWQFTRPGSFCLARYTEDDNCSSCVEEFTLLSTPNTDRQNVNPTLTVSLFFSSFPQVCDMCVTTDPSRHHPPENAIDGTEQWWQSPPLSRGMRYNEVNLTIDLGQVSILLNDPFLLNEDHHPSNSHQRKQTPIIVLWTIIFSWHNPNNCWGLPRQLFLNAA